MRSSGPGVQPGPRHLLMYVIRADVPGVDVKEPAHEPSGPKKTA